jgi:hypothetical protein
VAARPKTRNVFYCSNTGIVCSNPTRSMDVSLRYFCVCGFPVQLNIRFHNFRVNSQWEQTRQPNALEQMCFQNKTNVKLSMWNTVEAYRSFRRRRPHIFSTISLYMGWDRAVAQAVSHWLPTAAARVRVRVGICGLWSTKRYWGSFSPNTSVSPADNSTNFSIIMIARDWQNRPISGRSAEWTQLDSTPHYTN